MGIKIDIEKQNKDKPSSSSQLVPKKVLVHGKGGSFYAVRYVNPMSGSEEKDDDSKQPSLRDMDKYEIARLIFGGKLNQSQLHEAIDRVSGHTKISVAKQIDQSGLHKMINDKDKDVRVVVAEKIDQDGLHKMMNDVNEDVRGTVASKIDRTGIYKMMNDESEDIRGVIAIRMDQTGLHEMLNDKSEHVRSIVSMRIDQDGLHKLMKDKSEEVRSKVTDRIDQSGLHKMMKDESEDVRKNVTKRIIQSDLNEMMHDKSKGVRDQVNERLESIDTIKTMIDSYDKNKKIELSKYVKDEIVAVMKNERKSVNIVKCTDEFYKNINNSKFGAFHLRSKKEWEIGSSTNLALLLKDSVKRQFGGEIRHHGGVMNQEEEINELYKGYDKNEVDEYVKVQKDLTRVYLDQMFPDTDNITIYRGTTEAETQSFDDDDDEDNNKIIVKSNPLSSWTISREVASEFGETGVVLATSVHKDDIWSTFMSHALIGENVGNEREILLIGNKDREVSII